MLLTVYIHAASEEAGLSLHVCVISSRLSGSPDPLQSLDCGRKLELWEEAGAVRGNPHRNKENMLIFYYADGTKPRTSLLCGKGINHFSTVPHSTTTYGLQINLEKGYLSEK